MELTALSFCSKVIPFSSSSQHLLSLRHFNKQLVFKKCNMKSAMTVNNTEFVRTPLSSCTSFATANVCSRSMNRIGDPFNGSQFPFSLLCAPNAQFTRLSILAKCLNSSSEVPVDTNSENLLLKIFKIFSPESLKSTLSNVTAFGVCKWCLVFFVAIAASKWIMNLLFNPFFWMYFSWAWLFWPWIVAVGVGIYGLYCLNRHIRGEASLFEQFAIVTSAFTWLTLVPPAHFNGFLEGWPFVFFFVYHYFFFLNVSVRKRLYGDYYPREHDIKWDISLPNWHKLSFFVGVMVGHWLAALEGTELHLIPGGWNNVAIWALIMSAMFMQYHSTLYLAKYSVNVVVPTAVVQFGPYRFVRHPIYASTVLLFISYFAALRAPMSALFMVVVCLMYYGQKVKVEEALMLETFGERYTEYMNKVRFKLIPYVC